jgi:Tol biopolymer transport system component
LLKRFFSHLVIGFGLLLFGACSPTTDGPDPDPILETGVQTGSLLPHSLYFLSDQADGVFQVWFIDAGGAAAHQVTSEPGGVIQFDVSPTDGQVAYITGNQLYLINSDGSGRTLLVDGGEVEDQNRTYQYTQQLNGVRWAPTGEMLAYGQNGIHLYFIAEQSDVHLIENEIEELEGGQLHPVAIISPVSWSPDAVFLLVEIGFLEGGVLGTYHLQNDHLVRFGGFGGMCCHPSWTPDGRSVLVASPIFGNIPSGLWRYDAQTGAEEELLHHTSEDGTLNFAGWPLQLPDGGLRYFFNNMAAFPQTEALLLMVSTGADGHSNREIIRSEYWENYEVLWAEDGSLAISVQPPTGVGASWPRTGPIVIIPASDEPVVPLTANGYSLRWGP